MIVGPGIVPLIVCVSEALLGPCATSQPTVQVGELTSSDSIGAQGGLFQIEPILHKVSACPLSSWSFQCLKSLLLTGHVEVLLLTGTAHLSDNSSVRTLIVVIRREVVIAPARSVAGRVFARRSLLLLMLDRICSLLDGARQRGSHHRRSVARTQHGEIVARRSGMD